MHVIVSRAVAAALLAVLSIFALAGRGPSSTSLEEQLQHVASAASGTTLLVEAWCDGRVPRAYAIHTVERAWQSLNRISGSLSASSAPSDRVQAAMAEIVQLEAAIASARQALEREDRDAARSALELLRQLDSEARRQSLAEASS